MALYSYSCPGGHLTEARREYGDVTIPCPRCGAQAQRASVYRFSVSGGPQPKYRLSEAREAAAEANYYHERMENDRGHSIPRIPVEALAREDARKRGAKVLPIPRGI